MIRKTSKTIYTIIEKDDIASFDKVNHTVTLKNGKTRKMMFHTPSQQFPVILIDGVAAEIGIEARKMMGYR